ncbi:helix-turn-helix domain-containing protein [Dokdonia sp.]|uniref:helix-turn-helix domain-containing protein n=1 Tax=Dokdonia sp. TaxID=2024995 RepID=UPI0032644282
MSVYLVRIARYLEGIHYNITSLIDILGLVQGLFLGAILILESKKQRPTLFLGLFLLAYSFELLNTVLEDLNILNLRPGFLFLPIDFLYVTMPLFYLYVKSITNSVITRKNVVLILLPGIIEFLFFSVIFFLPASLKLEISETSNALGIIALLILVLSLPYSLYYVIRIIKHINSHRKKIENYYSNLDGKLLNWAKGVVLFMLIFHLFWMIEIFQEDLFFETYTYPILSAINVIFIFWIGISGLRQSKVIGSKNESSDEDIVIEPLNDFQTEIDEIPDEDFQRLVHLMEEDAYYKEPNLSLADVAKTLQVPQRKLSQLINTNAHKNFNQFVNYYRVEEAKKLLKDSTYTNLNMLGIAFDSGFNSKASFFSVFKKFTSVTPNAYKNQS